MSAISDVLQLFAYLFVFAVGMGVLWVAVLYIIDVTQTTHAIRRNFPVVGRFRYMFEHLGEFFRQYFFALDREEIQNQLIAMGVNPEDAKLRISQMTESELAEVQQHLDEMPAGGISVLGAALLIFIILIITDMLGATDIFPFVHNINK